jgi:hypothetical protein
MRGAAGLLIAFGILIIVMLIAYWCLPIFFRR